MTAGKGYTLRLAHYQGTEAPATEISLSVMVPKAVDLVGSDEIVLRSRYDLIPIRLFPPYRDDVKTDRDDVVPGELAISTEPPSKGPTVRLPIIVAPLGPARP